MTEPKTMGEAIEAYYADPKLRAKQELDALERQAHGWTPNPEMERMLATRDRVGYEAWLKAGNGDDGGLAIYETSRAAAIAIGAFKPPKVSARKDSDAGGGA